MHILVVGAGSIGQRHIKNLVGLGITVSIVEPTKNGFVEGWGRTLAGKFLYSSILEAFEQPDYDAAIVAVPTYLHMEVAVSLAQHNMPLFIEKPVSHCMEDVLFFQGEMEHYKQWAVVGYSMRFHPAIQIIKDLLPQIGTPLYARAEVGQYLPDWHPEEDYRNWYMAHEDQGGGALLDLSHEIDYMRWLFGDIKVLEGYVSTHPHSNLEMDADNIAELTGVVGESVICSIHMDLLDRSYNRRLRIVGSEGTISWDWGDGSVLLYLPGGEDPNEYPYYTDRNIQFKEEMEAFVDSVQSGIPHPTLATLEDGIEVLKVCLSLKEQNGRG